MMKHNKRLLILILLVLSCLALAVTGSVAAYNKTNFVKRVVTTKSDSKELRFSSNYLSRMGRDSTDYSDKVIRISGAGLSVGVTVCNHPQNDVTRFSSANIPFTLNVVLLDSKGVTVTDLEILSKIKVNDTPLTENFSKSATLPGGQSSMKLFTFSCSAKNAPSLKDYCLRIDAIPTDAGMDKLGADLLLASGDAMDISWSGGFVDDQTRKSTNYDAFNYEIHGSAEGIVTLTVNSNLKISQFSLEELGLSVGTSSPIQFSVGGEGKPTSYRLQFYRTGAIPADEAWTTVNGYIIFNFEAKSNE
ncbi:MAG: hypothetical protein SOX71_01885 [Candidatus Faecousia sp.]|nr:hypothetical protein [Candidatus Faecousia sp.]